MSASAGAISRPDESSALLTDGEGGYGSLEDGSRSMEPLRVHKAPDKAAYQRLSVKLTFFFGVALLAVNLFAFLYLVTLLFHPHLRSPFATSPLLQANLHLFSLLIMLPSIILFDYSSSTTRKVHLVSLALLGLVAILLVSISEYRHNGTAVSSLPALVCLSLSLLWALSAGKVVESLHSDAVASQAEPPHVRIAEDSIEAPPKSQKWAKFILATFGSSLVTVLMLLLTINVGLDGWSSGNEVAAGQKVNIELGRSELWVRWDTDDETAKTLRQTQPFRLHVGVECAPETSSSKTSDWPRSNDTISAPEQPTALFFPTLTAVSGYASSHWLRTMVHRAARTPTGNGTEDGHLALRRAVWYDAPGTGSSDYVRTEENLELQALAVAEALNQLGLLADLHESKTQTHAIPVKDQYTLVSLGSGSLVADLFAYQLPQYVHSRIIIDGETVDTFYGDAVSKSSGLRAGYGSQGRTTVFGRVWRDLLPALWSPLRPCRLLSVLSGQAPDVGESAAGGSSAKFFNAICSADARAPGVSLLTRLSHNTEASRGPASSNARRLRQAPIEEQRRHLLSTRPTAVLSSFWKVMRDPSGWGRVQREDIVKYALEGSKDTGSDSKRKSRLVGWWRVGVASPDPPRGDHGGRAQGLCSSDGFRGRLWCEEAVRKVLAWQQVNHTTEASAHSFSSL